MEKENKVFLTKTDDTDSEGHTNKQENESLIGEGEEDFLLPDEISWEAPEFEHVEKSTTWYWGSMAVAIMLIAIALWQKNFLFAVFIVIAELAVFMFAGEKPKMWKFTIDARGVTIEKHKTYKFKDIIQYDIHAFSDEYHELVLQTRSKVQHYIKIFIRVEDEEAIEDVLEGRVKRGEIEVSFIEVIERFIGF